MPPQGTFPNAGPDRRVLGGVKLPAVDSPPAAAVRERTRVAPLRANGREARRTSLIEQLDHLR
jgi:hypothetical protein